MGSKIKLKEGEVLNILVGRLKKSKSEIALDLNVSDQTLSKAFASEVLTLNTFAVLLFVGNKGKSVNLIFAIPCLNYFHVFAIFTFFLINTLL